LCDAEIIRSLLYNRYLKRSIYHLRLGRLQLLLEVEDDEVDGRIDKAVPE
jgi:hypothetical protein